MILLHNPQSSISRRFTHQYRSYFDTILYYPSFINEYPSICKFPAVCIDVPKYIIDNTLWTYIKAIPSYQNLAIPRTFVFNNNIKKMYPEEILMCQRLIEINNWEEEFIYLIQFCNVPDPLVRYVGWIIQHCVDTGINYINDLSESAKYRSIRPVTSTAVSITLDTSLDLYTTIESSKKIIYPENIQEVLDKIEEYRIRSAG